CDTVILIPLSFCSYNVSTIFNGLVYYDQWSCLCWWQLFLVVIGICILLCGVLILSWRKDTVPKEGLLAEDRKLLDDDDIEGLTELYEGEDPFLSKYNEIDNNSLDIINDNDSNSSNSSKYITKFHEMLQ